MILFAPCDQLTYQQVVKWTINTITLECIIPQQAIAGPSLDSTSEAQRPCWELLAYGWPPGGLHKAMAQHPCWGADPLSLSPPTGKRAAITLCLQLTQITCKHVHSRKNNAPIGLCGYFILPWS